MSQRFSGSFRAYALSRTAFGGLLLVAATATALVPSDAEAQMRGRSRLPSIEVHLEVLSSLQAEMQPQAAQPSMPFGKPTPPPAASAAPVTASPRAAMRPAPVPSAPAVMAKPVVPAPVPVPPAPTPAPSVAAAPSKPLAHFQPEVTSPVEEAAVVEQPKPEAKATAKAEAPKTAKKKEEKKVAEKPVENKAPEAEAKLPEMKAEETPAMEPDMAGMAPLPTKEEAEKEAARLQVESMKKLAEEKAAKEAAEQKAAAEAAAMKEAAEKEAAASAEAMMKAQAEKEAAAKAEAEAMKADLKEVMHDLPEPKEPAKLKKETSTGDMNALEDLPALADKPKAAEKKDDLLMLPGTSGEDAEEGLPALPTLPKVDQPKEEEQLESLPPLSGIADEMKPAADAAKRVEPLAPLPMPEADAPMPVPPAAEKPAKEALPAEDKAEEKAEEPEVAAKVEGKAKAEAKTDDVAPLPVPPAPAAEKDVAKDAAPMGADEGSPVAEPEAKKPVKPAKAAAKPKEEEGMFSGLASQMKGLLGEEEKPVAPAPEEKVAPAEKALDEEPAAEEKGAAVTAPGLPPLPTEMVDEVPVATKANRSLPSLGPITSQGNAEATKQEKRIVVDDAKKSEEEEKPEADEKKPAEVKAEITKPEAVATPAADDEASLPPLPPVVAGEKPDDVKKDDGELSLASLDDASKVTASAKKEEAQNAAAEVGKDTEGRKRVRLVFGKDDTESVPASMTADIDALVQTLKDNSGVKLQISSYAGGADEQESIARRISLKRALMVRTYFIEKGINSKRIDVKAMGNQSAAGEPAERVDIVVL